MSLDAAFIIVETVEVAFVVCAFLRFKPLIKRVCVYKLSVWYVVAWHAYIVAQWFG